jgi:type VI secretion system protein VasG
MIAMITRLQLGRIEKRIKQNHKVPFTFDDDVVKAIVGRCTELESGGRMIDAILTNSLLPSISQEILERMMAGRSVNRIHVTTSGGDFKYQFD